MAAYAALLSLMDLVEQIQHHPHPPLSLDQKQAKSLTEKVRFLQGFLEDFHSRGFSQEIQALESRITDVAHAASDVIESQILLVRGLKKRRWLPNFRIRNLSTDWYKGLDRVIKDLQFIEKEAAIYTKKKGSTFEEDDQLPPRHSLFPPLGSSLIEKTTTMVGFDDISIRIMDRLTRNQPKRVIVPIVGMGGAGKTTLARNIYERQLIVDCFETRSWVTISQRWTLREVLIQILLCQRNHKSREELNQESEGDLCIQLYQSLIGRKYLIVMDDMWSIEVWDKLSSFLPDKNNGSRIMITTRLSKLAFDIACSPGVNVDLLDEDTSWHLLCKKVFADKSCPLYLEESGRKIARNCRGLPLSIVTIAGLLAKSNMTRDYWEYVAENLSSLVNSKDDERCLRIMSLSYRNLPIHLKPCFLYMGLFPEDERLRASYLIRLWVAEGFLKPINGKALEVVGEGYLSELVSRNLVSVHQWGLTGKIKYCFVHDLLRDLCLREAQKEKFFFVARIDKHQGNGISNTTQRRIAIHYSKSSDEYSPHHDKPYSMPFLRSCITDYKKCHELISLRSAHLLRILAGVHRSTIYGLNDIVPLVNLRFLSISDIDFKGISLLWPMSWSLQTLMVEPQFNNAAQLDIWKMPQLRHVKIDHLDILNPSPPLHGGQLIVLENLQTLSMVRNFKCSEEVVKRIPNVKKLTIYYRENTDEGLTSSTDYCIDNLGRLQNLESLKIIYDWQIKISFIEGIRLYRHLLPNSHNKLTLQGFKLDTELMSTMIGNSLPVLQALKLIWITFIGDEWNLVEGQFSRLKYLLLFDCRNSKWWKNADSTHIPCLERLHIAYTYSLVEFPKDMGDIPTLQLIDLEYVMDSVIIISAKRMLEELEEQFGNVEGLLIRVAAPEQERELLKRQVIDFRSDFFSQGRNID